MPAWEDLPEKERTFQARLMEVYAGFFEHTDVQVGRLIDELEARGIRDNTMVIYIVSDNGASAEGMNGSIAELNAQNGIPTTVEEHMAVLDEDWAASMRSVDPRQTTCTTRPGPGPAMHHSATPSWSPPILAAPVHRW